MLEAMQCNELSGKSGVFRRLVHATLRGRAGVAQKRRSFIVNACRPCGLEALEERRMFAFAASHNIGIIGGFTSVNGGFIPTTGADVSQFNFTSLAPAQVTTAGLAAFDTIVLNVVGPNGMNGNVNNLTVQEKADLVTFLGNGNKVIIVDSESTSQNYSWLPYSFTTNNPGANGANGTATDVEENTLSSTDPNSPYYVNLPLLGSQTDALGDSNVMVSFDSHWHLDLVSHNSNGIAGPSHVYAEYANPTSTVPGLLIYNGEDTDSMPTTVANKTTGPGALRQIYINDFGQPFGPSGLPGTLSISGIDLTPGTASKSAGSTQIMSAFVHDQLGAGAPNVHVNFVIKSGPDAGASGILNPITGITDSTGHVTFTFTNNGTAGIDGIGASFVDVSNVTHNATDAAITFLSVNAAPVVTGAVVSAQTACGFTLQNAAVTFTGNFTDANAGDLHTALINWGDGTTSAGTVNDAAHTVVGTHSYVAPGDYTVSVVVTDNGTPILSSTGGATAVASIYGAKIDTAGNLEVDGTNCDDTIRVAKANASGSLLSVRFGNTFIGNYSPTGKIIINGRDGNDYLSVDANVTRAAIIYGGNGNDSIRGGGGADILLGNDGNDQIFGGGGANILIGGNGSDNLQGGTGGDVMIGGSTSYDAVQASLIALSNEWASANTYAVRIGNLKTGGGAASGVPLNGNVLDDGTADVLATGGGQDFFLANLAQDSLIGAGSNQVN